MFFIKELITPFLLPPGCFIVLMIVLGIRFRIKRQRAAGAVLLSLAALLWTASARPVADLLEHGLSAGVAVPGPRVRGDVIVLLGGGQNDRVLDILGRPGVAGPDTTVRVVAAARLQKRLGIPVIASGGSPFGESVSEAAIMGRMLRDLGVPADRILLEDRSRDTGQNAEFVKRICDRRGFRHPLLVSSMVHLRRARMVFRRIGLPVTAVSYETPMVHPPAYGWEDFLPGNAFADVAACVKEYLGIVYTAVAF